MKSSYPLRARGTSTALRLIAWLGIGTLLYVARGAFIPIALAVLFSLVLTTPVEALCRLGLPRGAAAFVILVTIVCMLAASLNLLWAPAQLWWASAPQTLKTIEQKARPIARLVKQVDLLTNRAGEIADPAGLPGRRPVSSTPPLTTVPTTVTVLATASEPQAHVARVFNGTRAIVVGIVTVTILVFFLLAGGPPMVARMGGALASDTKAVHLIRVIDAVRGELSRYYTSVAVINVGLGLATAGASSLLGMPNPLLWGAVAALFNFVPYVGSASTLVLLTIVAFVTFDELGRVAAVAASYLALTTIEGQLVQPLVVGRRLELNPLMVFLALWFGGWFWGIAGVFIAVPSLVALKVVAEHSQRGSGVVGFLSPTHIKRSRSMRASDPAAAGK